VAVFLAVVRQSGPHVVEASLIPTALFYCCLVLAGLGTAFVAALMWLYGSVLIRIVRQRPVPPLLVLGAIGITVRTTVAFLSGSSFIYFAQPVLNSMVMGVVFLVSIVVGRPLVERLALDFWPLTPDVLERPTVTRLLRRLTYLWAAVNLAIGAATLLLLLWLPMATYVALKPLVSLALMGTGIAITIDRSVRTARREGYVPDRPISEMGWPIGTQPALASAADRPARQPRLAKYFA
jgi:uncharacterized membrane protein